MLCTEFGVAHGAGTSPPSPLGKAGLQAQAPVLIPQIITTSDGYQPYGYFSYGHYSYLAVHQLKASHSASPLVITAR